MTARTHRLAALWFADVADPTGAAPGRAAVEALRGVTREVAGSHEGRVVKHAGGTILAEFPSADGAARSAIELRDRLAATLARRALEPLAVRVGVHVGDIVAAADGDVYGDGVNLAARIHGAAEPGEVWVSEDVWRLLRQRTEFRFEPLGAHRLKGIPTPVALYAAGLRKGAPPTRERVVEPIRRSLAVLPFAHLSPSAENEYFSDGVTEEILTSLARIEGLRVISRTSAMRYKKTDKTIREIAEELGVDSILEGSVRQVGDRVRITAQLIDTESDAHLWAESYDRDLEDIFAIQTDVAERIVESLRVRLAPKERARLAGRPTQSLEAYQAYLRGRHFLARRTDANLRQAIEWFGKAVGADPAFARAWAGLADAWGLLLHYSPTPPPEAGFEARTAAGRALLLDSGLGEAHASLGNVAWTGWWWEEAEAEYRYAIEAAPGYATAYLWYGNFLSLRGRTEEAFAAFERALELDPVSLPAHMGYGAALNHGRRFDEAIEVYRRAVELDPGYVPAHNNLVNPLLALGRLEEALDEMETASRLGHDGLPPDFVTEVRAGFESGGERGLWTAVLEGLRSRPEVRGRDYFMVQAAARLGRLDEAFLAIGTLLVDRRMSALQIPFDPLLDPLRSDPRWEVVLRRLELV